MKKKNANTKNRSVLNTHLARYITFLDSIHTEHSAHAHCIEPDEEVSGEIERFYSAKRVWVAKRRSA